MFGQANDTDRVCQLGMAGQFGVLLPPWLGSMGNGSTLSGWLTRSGAAST
jgi:hypothetical protein